MVKTVVTEKYNMAALLDTLIAERATRIAMESGSQPKIDIPVEGVFQSCVMDIAPITTQQAIELLQCIASAEQMRELDLCGRTSFTHIHSAPSGAGRIRVTGEIHHDVVTIYLDHLGTAG
jgi:hypothetical protein